ncbi:hypothetical protein [uncultured Croceitalea sp.]|uniref:hypothetical protein n=1 Tax=uncultured Croceitalea sp. TaxID=1798908 RepID=UPI00330616E0
MKKYFLSVMLGIFAMSILQSQIKIGNNPQNIDAASVLELESNGRVLVITRVSDAQMNTIAPLPGALVYNTDLGCIFYYDGTAWANLCEEGIFNTDFEVVGEELVLTDSQGDTVSVSLSDLGVVTFSTDPVFNPVDNDNTIVITETGDNVNIEVGEITGFNIVDSSINGFLDIQDGSIVSSKLQDDAVDRSKIDANVAGVGISQAPDGSLDVDLTEITGTGTLTSPASTLTISGDPDNALFNSVGLDVADNAITNEKMADNAIGTAEIINDAVTNAKILDASITNNKLDKPTIPISGFAPAATDVDFGSNRLLNVVDPVAITDAANRNYVDNAVGGLATLTDGTIYIGNATNLAQERTISGDATIDNTGVLTIEPDAVGTTEIIDANITNAKLDKTNIPLSGFGAATGNVSVGGFQLNNVAEPTAAQDAATRNYVDNSIATSNALANTNIYVGSATGVATGVTMTGDATINNAGVLTIEPNAVGTIEIIDNAVTSTKILDGEINTVDIAADAIDNTKIADNAINTENIADGQVQTADILDDNVTPAKIEEGTANQVLRTNAAGTDVEWGVIDANSITGQDLTATDGSITVATGTGATLVASSISVTADGITNDKIADNAINTENIADGEINTADIAADAIDNTKIADDAVQVENILNGTANQVLRTNAAGTDVEWGVIDANSITGQDLTATDGSITVATGTGATLVASSIAVTADGITNDKIADNAINTENIADGQVQTADILDDNVTPAKIEEGTANQVLRTNAAGTDVEWGVIDANSITGQDLTATDGSITVATGTGATLVASSISVTADGITNDKIADNAINTENIADGQVQTADILDDNITPDKIEQGTNGQILTTDAVGDVVWAAPAFSSVTTDATINGDGNATALSIADGAIVGGAGGTILDNSITASDLATDSVDAGEIRIDAVGQSEIRDDAVTTGEILDLTILNEDISVAAAIDGSKIIPDFNLGITTTAGLSVQADILLNGNAVVPDYVFQKYFTGFSALDSKYEFQSLKSIEAFLIKNNHLPGIQSAQEAQESGSWNLSRSNLKNLEKIEELFLHTIEQEKKIEALKSKNEVLAEELDSLKKDLAEIKALLKKQ